MQSIVETVAHLSHVIICVINYYSDGAQPMPHNGRSLMDLNEIVAMNKLMRKKFSLKCEAFTDFL